MKTQNFKALIIDDEEDAREIIALLLAQNFPQITVTAKAESVAQASHLFVVHNPDIVFLDIELADGSGFDLLERFPTLQSLVIFITAFDNYAIKAIKASAQDYILKPVNREEFKQTINKALGKLEQLKTYNIVNPKPSNKIRKIAIPSLTGYSFVNVDTIVRCEADGNYTAVYYSKTSKTMVSKTLSLFETDLKKFGFMRIHHKHLVNLNCVVNYTKGRNGGYVTMNDGTELEVSARKKPHLLKTFAEGG